MTKERWTATKTRIAVVCCFMARQFMLEHLSMCSMTLAHPLLAPFPCLCLRLPYIRVIQRVLSEKAASDASSPRANSSATAAKSQNKLATASATLETIKARELMHV